MGPIDLLALAGDRWEITWDSTTPEADVPAGDRPFCRMIVGDLGWIANAAVTGRLYVMGQAGAAAALGAIPALTAVGDVSGQVCASFAPDLLDDVCRAIGAHPKGKRPSSAPPPSPPRAAPRHKPRPGPGPEPGPEPEPKPKPKPKPKPSPRPKPKGKR